jgi:hypothetical protein
VEDTITTKRTRPTRRGSDLLLAVFTALVAIFTLALVGTNVVLALVTSDNQKDADKHAATSAKQATLASDAALSRSAQGTALIYLTRIEIERNGLVAMAKENKRLQSFLNTTDFDPSVNDGLALLAAGHPPTNLIASLSVFSGDTAHLFFGVIVNLGLNKPLSPDQLGQVCLTIRAADQALRDLSEVTGRQVKSAEARRCQVKQ